MFSCNSIAYRVIFPGGWGGGRGHSFISIFRLEIIWNNHFSGQKTTREEKLLSDSYKCSCYPCLCFVVCSLCGIFISIVRVCVEGEAGDGANRLS